MELPCVLGLTGSIGTGKSTVARILKHLKIPVIDADQLVHTLYETSPLIIKQLQYDYPFLVKNGKIERRALADHMVRDASLLPYLERILHPLVKEALIKAIDSARLQGMPLIVLEVPLLFETGLEILCDFTLVVHTNEALQRERVLKRNLMTEAYFQKIIARQLPQSEKIKRADFTLDTSRSRVHILRELLTHLERICLSHA